MKAATTIEYARNVPLKQIMKLVDDFPKPSLNSKQVLIKTHFIGINPADWRLMHGFGKLIYMFKKLPLVFGNDSCGTVVEIGSQVSSVQIGDVVVCGSVGGAFAEYRLVEESDIVKKPQELSDSFAASLPTVAYTMYTALTQAGFVTSEDNSSKSVLIVGGSGGTGSIGIILAKHLFHIGKVYATCSTKNIDTCKSMGADVVIDYTTQTPREMGTTVFADQKVSAVVDTVGEEYERIEVLMENALDKNGKYMAVGFPVPEEQMGFTSILGLLWFTMKKYTSFKFKNNPQFHMVVAGTNTSDLHKVMDFFAQHKQVISLLPIHIYPFTQIVEALEQSRSHRVVGKIVIQME